MKKRKIILGTDWWTDCDDVVALRIMVRKHLEGEISLLGICINACMENSSESLSAFLMSEGLDNIPIGIDRDATDFGIYREVMYQTNLAKYPHYMTNDKCEESVELYRRILSECEEKLDIVEIGYPQVLANLLKSPSDKYSSLTGEELVLKKVNKLWIMAGNWENEIGKENNFCRNQRSREGGSYLCDRWPTPITFLGWEVGNTVITGGGIKTDTDLLKQAMADIGFPEGRSSWDPMLCLMACIGDEEKAGYDTVKGTASVNCITGENFFKKDNNGNHCYVVKKFEDNYYSKNIDLIL